MARRVSARLRSRVDFLRRFFCKLRTVVRVVWRSRALDRSRAIRISVPPSPHLLPSHIVFRPWWLDSVDALEALIWIDVCKSQGWSSIESPGYGKGYVVTDNWWLDVLKGLDYLRRQRGMTIVALAHSAIEIVNDPRVASYTSYQLRLHKRARGLVQDAMDAIGFLAPDLHVQSEEIGFGKKRNRADGGSQRWLHFEGRPSFVAKNRYGLPAKMPVPKNFSYEALAPVPTTAAVGGHRRQTQPQTHPQTHHTARCLMTTSTLFPETFDPTTQEGNSWDVLPVGEYVAQIVEASIQQPNSGDGYHLALTWKITEGDFEGRQVWQRITYLHSSEQAQTIGRKTLKDLCVATDVAEQVDDAEVFLFKPVRIRLGIEKDKQGIYPDKNRISRILPLETKPAETEQPAKPVTPATKAAAAAAAPRGPGAPAPWHAQR